MLKDPQAALKVLDFLKIRSRQRHLREEEVLFDERRATIASKTDIS